MVDGVLLPEHFWVKIGQDDHWQIGARIVNDGRTTWWRWGDRWPVRTDAISEVGPMIDRPQ